MLPNHPLDLGRRFAQWRRMPGVPALSQKTGVLFLSSAEEPGADTFIHTLIMRHLDRSRFDVHVAYSADRPDAKTPAYEALARIPNLHLRPFNFGPSLSGRSRAGKTAGVVTGLSALAGYAGLARYIRHHRIRILHSTDRPRDAVSCAVLGKLTGAKSVIHAHLKCAEWMGRSLRWSMGQVDALAGVSEFVVQSLVDNGYTRQKTHVVLNAIELAAWDYRLDGGPVRRALGIADGAPVVACAARLFRGKGQDDVVRAVAAIRDEFTDVRLLIIGRDDLQAMRTSFTEELRTLARELGVSEHVIFTGHRTDMAALMAACDVFALPSMEEPFGLVFLEAMAMKKPVIAFNSGGAPEVVEHGRSGLLSPVGDRQALASNLRLVLRDTHLRAKLGEHGRREVEARFTPQRMAADTARMYASLTGAMSGNRTGVLDRARSS
jgi:glycosyltransferase involved in cell wall biosynthesis